MLLLRKLFLVYFTTINAIVNADLIFSSLKHVLAPNAETTRVPNIALNFLIKAVSVGNSGKLLLEN